MDILDYLIESHGLPTPEVLRGFIGFKTEANVTFQSLLVKGIFCTMSVSPFAGKLFKSSETAKVHLRTIYHASRSYAYVSRVQAYLTFEKLRNDLLNNVGDLLNGKWLFKQNDPVFLAKTLDFTCGLS